MKKKSLCTTTSSTLQNSDNWLQGPHRAPDPQFSPRTFLSRIVSKFILEHPAIIATTLGTPISSQGSRNGSTGHFHSKKCTSDISRHFCTQFRSELHFFQNFLSCSPKSGEQSYILSTAIWLLHAELQGPKVGTRHKTNSGR